MVVFQRKYGSAMLLHHVKLINARFLSYSWKLLYLRTLMVYRFVLTPKRLNLFYLFYDLFFTVD